MWSRSRDRQAIFQFLRVQGSDEAAIVQVRQLSMALALVSQLGSEDEHVKEWLGLPSESYFFRLPILYFSPFNDLISQGDSRALIVLYLSYNAALLLARPDREWWLRRRASIMVKLIRHELGARGIDADKTY